MRRYKSTIKDCREWREELRAQNILIKLSANIARHPTGRKTIHEERNELTIAIGCNYLTSLKMQSTGALRRIMRERTQNVECAIRARFISRSHARERLISRVFYDLAISPCCADFINSTSYLPYSPIPLFSSLFHALSSVSSVIPVTRTNFTSSARTVTSGITGCIIYSANSQTLEALSSCGEIYHAK